MRNMTKADAPDGGKWWLGLLARRTATGDDAGQSFVELALIAPLFFLLLLGAAEFAFLAYANIEVSNAARAGVAYGAQSITTASDAAGIRAAAINDGADIAGLNATATQFCSCSNAASTQVSCASAPATCALSGARVLNYLQVNTTATVNPFIHYPGFRTTFTLNGQAIMRVEQ